MQCGIKQDMVMVRENVCGTTKGKPEETVLRRGMIKCNRPRGGFSG